MSMSAGSPGQMLSALQHLQVAEDAAYPNRRAERDWRSHVEHQVNEEVARSGELSMRQAQAFAAEVAARRTRADALEAELQRLWLLQPDGSLGVDDLEAWDAANREVDRLTALLEADAQRAAWHLNRLENPLDTWDAMQNKYGALRNAI
jgi:hypothetical protein